MTGTGVAVDFTAFFGAEYERLFQCLYLLCGNKADAEDLAQETMARAFERWDRVRAAETPTGYVFQIGFNLHRSMLRRARRALKGGDRVAVRAEPNLGQTRLEVLEALSSLPAAQRQALVLVEWLGFSASARLVTRHIRRDRCLIHVTCCARPLVTFDPIPMPWSEP